MKEKHGYITDFKDPAYTARLFRALGHENRLYVMKGFERGDDLNEIMVKTGIVRSTLQRHLEALNYAELIERVEGRVPYKLTHKGEEILGKIEEIDKEIVGPRYDKMIELEKSVIMRMREAKPGVLASNLKEKDLENLNEALKSKYEPGILLSVLGDKKLENLGKAFE